MIQIYHLFQFLMIKRGLFMERLLAIIIGTYFAIGAIHGIMATFGGLWVFSQTGLALRWSFEVLFWPYHYIF